MNFRVMLALTAALSLPAAVRADEADAKLLKPFISPQTALVVTLDLSAADIGPALKSALQVAPSQLGNKITYEMRTAAKFSDTFIEKLRAADVKRLYLVVTPQGLQTNEWVFALAATSAEKSPAVRAALPMRLGWTVAEKDGAVFFGLQEVWNRIQQPPAGEDAVNLLKRIELSKPNPISVVACLPETHRKALAELSPQIPSELGGGSTASLVDGFDAIELNATTGDHAAISLVIYARDAAAAKQIETLVTKGLSLAKKAPPRADLAEKAARSLAAEIKPTVAENRVEMSIDLVNAKVQEAIKGLTNAASEHTRRLIIRNSLKQIALAMHNYHDTNRSFPPGAIVDKSGKPLLSWRVRILPYFDQSGLYEKFKLDEPWDSENNRKLIDQMPDQYAGFAALKKEGKTSILGFTGPGALFPKPGQPVGIKDIKDGTSNTIMCIAAPTSQAVVWTKPDDLSITDQNLLSKVGVDNILAAFCDGSVRTIPMPSTLKGLLPYITINGREVIEP